ncbi:MAG: homoserine kinase [Actinomycetota bacterium]
MRVSVRVPATSANLGPGFDCFGLALDLCNEVTVDTEAEPGVTWEGEGADELPTDGTDMVSRAIADAASHPGFSLPAFGLKGKNRIPLERGLGSSAAAAVAGASIGYVLAGVRAGDAAEDGFDNAAVLEGHADNAAAAVYGGLTVVASGIVRRLDPHPSLAPVVFIPPERLATSSAREALSPTVPREDAVFNVGQAALTVIAFTLDPKLLLVAMQDRLHEDARAALMPRSASLLSELRGRQVPACLSGAGPSIIAFEHDGRDAGDPPDGWRAIRPGIRTEGVEVVVED